MDYTEALRIAAQEVLALKGHTVDVLKIERPTEIQGAIELAKIISKLSPIIGNLPSIVALANGYATLKRLTLKH